MVGFLPRFARQTAFRSAVFYDPSGEPGSLSGRSRTAGQPRAAVTAGRVAPGPERAARGTIHRARGTLAGSDRHRLFRIGRAAPATARTSARRFHRVAQVAAGPAVVVFHCGASTWSPLWQG